MHIVQQDSLGIVLLAGCRGIYWDSTSVVRDFVRDSEIFREQVGYRVHALEAHLLLLEPNFALYSPTHNDQHYH